MRLARRIALAAAGALLLGGMGGAPRPEPLPLACDVLQALPVEDLIGQRLDYQITQDRAGTDILMSMCSALGEDDLPAVTLLLRQDISAAGPQTALEQRETMLAELAAAFGQGPAAELSDIGEVAIWVADIGQLTVWYRAGRVMFILTAGGASLGTHRERAEEIAREIVTRFP